MAGLARRLSNSRAAGIRRRAGKPRPQSAYGSLRSLLPGGIPAALDAARTYLRNISILREPCRKLLGCRSSFVNQDEIWSARAALACRGMLEPEELRRVAHVS